MSLRRVLTAGLVALATAGGLLWILHDGDRDAALAPVRAAVAEAAR